MVRIGSAASYRICRSLNPHFSKSKISSIGGVDQSYEFSSEIVL